MSKYAFLGFGALFGFILSRAGATTYDFYAGLFLFTNMQLLWVIVVAAGLGSIGMTILKRMKATSVADAAPLNFDGKPYTKNLIPGSLLFGFGWGLAGACPGTVLAMLGEGKLGALFTITGIILGTYLYGLWQTRKDLKPVEQALEEA